MISVNDPDARHTRKSQHARRDGYRAHMAADPDTGIITGEKLTKASGEEDSDPAVAGEFAAAEAGGTGPAGGRDSGGADDALAWYGYTAYGTGELREAIANAGHRAVIKPKPVQSAVEGGFTLDDFTVDDQAGTVTCPAGVTRRIPPSRHVVFGAACAACPLCPRCTASKSGRVLRLHPLDRLLRAARGQWAADRGPREDYARHRPPVERVIAQVATWRGRRIKLRYRGTVKNHAWLKRRTAALNLRNLAGLGLTCPDGIWTLAT